MRKSFNWSLLDRNNLYSMLYSAGREFVGQRVSTAELHKYLSSHIKSRLPVGVRKLTDSKYDTKLLYMGGAYYGDLDRKKHKRFIEVVLGYNPKIKEIKITNYRWAKLCGLFADTILHEIIHMRQYRSRNFKDIPGYESTAHYHKQRMNQEYYGHRDEMGAFAFNIACDMINKFGYDPKEIRDYMDSERPRRFKHTSFTKFLMAFDYDHNHVKVQQMKQKVMKQLEYAAIGRPFKTSNYLTY